MNDAVIIGYGVVGKATAKSLGIKWFYDLKENNISLDETALKRFIFICLPTPTINKKCHTKDIDKTIAMLVNKRGKKSILIIRSTVEPGTTRKLSQKFKVPIIHHPEFLTESTALKDSVNPDLLIFGGDDKKAVNKLVQLYSKFSCPKIKMDSVSSEVLKYAINTFYATKVVFANQIYDLCQKMGADFDLIKETMYKRKWIGQNHLDVWHKGYRGAGGNCLEKDLEAFANFSKLPLLNLANKLNKQLLRTLRNQKKNGLKKISPGINRRQTD